MTQHDLTLIHRLSQSTAHLQDRQPPRPEARPSGAPTALERRVIGAFVAALLNPDQPAPQDSPLAALAHAEALTASRPGPYGRFPPAPLRAEDLDGPVYRAQGGARALLGERLASALEHAHLLAFHPGDDLDLAQSRLLGAGWRTQDLGAIEQIVSFVSYLNRVTSGLHSHGATYQPPAFAVA